MLNSQLILVLLGKPDCIEYVHFNSLKSLGSSDEVTTEHSCLLLMFLNDLSNEWFPSYEIS